MSIYFIPALIGLVLKLVVLAYAIKAKRVSTMFLSLIGVFAVHNAIEFLGYFQSLNDDAINIFFRLYYVATIYVICCILLHGLVVSKMQNAIVTKALILSSTALATTVMFSDLVVSGYYSIGYSMSAIEGTFYWLFVAYLLIILVSNVAVLLYGCRSAKSQLDSIRCIHSLLALSPIMLVLLIAIGFKLANISINATGLAPIATTIFLVVILKTEARHKLSDIRRFLPLSPEREITTKIMDLVDDYLNENGINYKKLQDGLEKEIIFYSLKKCNNNVSHTTEMMGLKNRSTLYSMMNRLDIDMKQLKQKRQQEKA